MTKAKTNALDSLRSLIAERQQYEQWISALEAKREGTPEHVFERVKADYTSRLDRVVADIAGHAEELQLSITTLSARLVEVARDEDTRREGLQEAELRAAVGEYEPEQWEQLRSDAEKELERIAADRASLDTQLGELRAIQKLSELGSTGTVPGAQVPEPALESPAPVPAAAPVQPAPEAAPPEKPKAASPPPFSAPAADAANAEKTAGDQGRLTLEPVAAAGHAASSVSRPRSKTPPSGVTGSRPRPEPPRPDSAKTLKCPECGTPNHPTEWYCERCGAELATV